jgi:hypothetical protein
MWHHDRAHFPAGVGRRNALTGERRSSWRTWGEKEEEEQEKKEEQEEKEEEEQEEKEEEESITPDTSRMARASPRSGPPC